MSAVGFGIVGGGWRTEFFLRIAKALPERFQVTGVVVRDADKGAAFERQWNVPTYRTVDALLDRAELEFVVVSVPRKVAPSIMLELVRRDVPVLCETPPAETLEEMISLYGQTAGRGRIQVAEQYAFQPNHAGRLAIVRSGRLGRVTQAQVSAAHDYHGISLMRRYLDIGFENAVIRASAFVSQIVEGSGRSGPPQEHRIVDSSQVMAAFDFGDRYGSYDFTGDQYFSWIRSPRLLVRGERGEINNFDIRYLLDHLTPVHVQLTRQQTGLDGNLEGFYLKGLHCGEQVVYTNATAPARLTDDEIAIAECLARMADYAAGGPDFYSLAEACQDHYLALAMQQSLRSGEAVTTETQCWASNGAAGRLARRGS
ncbi:Gfo/Idh/MocA family protein [Paenibacillus sacheonensis]|uniref:Gfo/Idh/MocA family oxidoreductase n=1 Tax=Paenibacillus sacheonensis TaxID=742054 RepID=A0A7X4YJP6_9BACL|nr:Gfo/Idh/MocA family oxidoreductase [Paenibacillus sacheonensis]MBM7564143.1 putative dehydrogenase [Paenibacillus sacheonensis]NBC67527.1 Gfo/Idh/MocA family oxidoreductase [Paenibacillus sacheonensis]